MTTETKISRIVNQQKQEMILQTLTMLLKENEITVDEFNQLLKVQTVILDRVLRKM